MMLQGLKISKKTIVIIFINLTKLYLSFSIVAFTAVTEDLSLITCTIF